MEASSMIVVFEVMTAECGGRTVSMGTSGLVDV